MIDAKKQKTSVSTENDVTDSVETSALTAEGGASLRGAVGTAAPLPGVDSPLVPSDIITAGWQHPEPEYFGFIRCRWRGRGHSGHL